MLKLALRIDEVCDATGLGRTSIYAAIKNGFLRARKCGRVTIILSSDLERFLQTLPALHHGPDTDEESANHKNTQP
jgi:excisionase family DNA binding protein